MEIRGPWKILKQEEVYSNPWISVHHSQVLTPKNTEGIYGVVHFKNLAVAVVPLDHQGNTYLVGQYRFPLKEYSWEVPEGGCPQNEVPLLAAKRELREETGLEAKKWTSLGTVALSNSATDERGLVYLAQDLTQGQADPDDDEVLELKKVSLKEAYQMAMEGQITDALAVVALSRVWHYLKGS